MTWDSLVGGNKVSSETKQKAVLKKAAAAYWAPLILSSCKGTVFSYILHVTREVAVFSNIFVPYFSRCVVLPSSFATEYFFIHYDQA
jgi:hypothetical protein